LDEITSRLSTKSRENLLSKLIANNTIDFTVHNVHAIVLWAVKNANQYFDDQLVTLFEDLSTFDGVENYKSNERVWEQHYWRYRADDHSHYKLDYRMVICKSNAMYRSGDYSQYQYPGDLHENCHDLIADIIAVMSNLGFKVSDVHSKSREWEGGKWQDFVGVDGETIFQVKAYLNGNLHMRFMPKAIRALNIKASQILKWVSSVDEVVKEMGYAVDEVQKYFTLNQQIEIRTVPLLASATYESEEVIAPVTTPQPSVKAYDNNLTQKALW